MAQTGAPKGRKYVSPASQRAKLTAAVSLDTVARPPVVLKPAMGLYDCLEALRGPHQPDMS